MKYKRIKKLCTFLAAGMLTFMLVTVDREVSLINDREPMVEFSITRVSEEYFAIAFLGYEREIKAKPIEEIWKKIVKSFALSEGEHKEIWQETVLV